MRLCANGYLLIFGAVRGGMPERLRHDTLVGYVAHGDRAAIDFGRDRSGDQPGEFHSARGRTVYLDNKFIAGEVDERYIVSTLRQHMLASGCTIKDKVEDASCVLEIRSGAVGTNRNDLLFGVPATSLPTGMIIGAPASIPEIPFFKRTAQQGVCKIAVFAYERSSGRPLWQSGTRQVASNTKDVWVFGAGPFTRGTIHNGTHLAGEHFQVPLASASGARVATADDVTVSSEMTFPGAAFVRRGSGRQRSVAGGVSRTGGQSIGWRWQPIPGGRYGHQRQW